jgi:hypothetical protein
MCGTTALGDSQILNLATNHPHSTRTRRGSQRNAVTHTRTLYPRKRNSPCVIPPFLAAYTAPLFGMCVRLSVCLLEATISLSYILHTGGIVMDLVHGDAGLIVVHLRISLQSVVVELYLCNFVGAMACGFALAGNTFNNWEGKDLVVAVDLDERMQYKSCNDTSILTKSCAGRCRRLTGCPLGCIPLEARRLSRVEY